MSKSLCQDDANAKIFYEIISDEEKNASIHDYIISPYSNPLKVIFLHNSKIIAMAPLVRNNQAKTVYLGHVAIEPQFNSILDKDELLQNELVNCLIRLNGNLKNILNKHNYAFTGPLGVKIQTVNNKINNKL